MPDALSLVLAIGCVLAVWGALLVLLAGLGRGVLGSAFGRVASMPDLVTCAWLGYAAAVVVLQLWQLWLPVDLRAVAALSILSALGWLAVRRRCSPYRRAISPLVLLGLAVVVVWVADRAIGPCAGYDSANYHLSMVRWYREHAAVPGLANLSPIYGTNSSGLLLPTLLEQGPGRGRSSHFANGFVLVLFLASIARLVGRRCEERQPGEVVRGAEIAAALSLFPAIVFIQQGAGSWVSTLATDLPVTLTVIWAACLAIEALAQRTERPALEPRFFTALVLFAVAPALKATALVFAAVAWAAVAAWALRRRVTRPRPAVAAVVLAAAAVLPWLARGVVGSGYPLFPAAVAGFDVDWRVPVEHLQGVTWWTRSYTRTPAAWELMVDLDGARWLSFWARSELRTALHEVLVPLASTAVFLLLRLAVRGAAPVRAGPPLLLVPLALAVPAWFLAAPAPRYGAFLFWVLCAQAGAALLPPVVAALPRPRAGLAGLLIFSLAVPLALHGYYTVKHHRGEPPLAVLAREWWTLPGPDHGFHPLHRPRFDRLRVCHGRLTVHVPAAQSEAPWPETLPWNAPLPATTRLLGGLCPRRPGELASGFRTETRGRSWAERNAAAVAAVAQRTGWVRGRLAVHFCVRPELIEEALRLAAGPPASSAERRR